MLKPGKKNDLITRLEVMNFRWNIMVFALAYSLITLVLYHKPLFSFAIANLDYHSLNGIIILAELVIMQVLSVFLLIMMMSFVRIIVKPICIIFFLLNAVGFYFITQYNVILDKTMMGNVFNTNLGEAGELYNPKILLCILLLGVLPSIVIARVKISTISALKRIIVMCVAILVTIIFAYANSKTWLWFDKNAKRVGGLSMPLSYVINSIRYSVSVSHNGTEIRLPDAHFTNNHQTIVVLVIGESARMANFSLYGYRRNTNPYLAKDNVVAMRDTTSCTTYTTESIKCMLSHLGSHSSRTLYESLPTYLQRNNVNVIWRSNNWGEPKMHVAQFEKANEIREKCSGDSCKKLDNDGVLLYRLDQELKKHLNDNAFIILHQTGSHGPQYSTKYPPQFETFKPVCKSVELQKCTHDELVNAYDNTIIYTDYFLHQVISSLESLKDVSSVMIYISDHGESLGEYNFYLHGVPYSFAPDVQKKIPFIIWTSDKFKKEHHLTNQNLAKQAHHSQDNVFHSIMGAFGATSEFYKKDLDVFYNNDAK
ncbi:MAG: phosphoethanolamine--lipid A transferase EptA [Proteobacteria bacterium]|nr:phosphoethanolamine--lipid A transferase EptA [Pseudomonadota bacterium]